jgi:hypothetical protein
VALAIPPLMPVWANLYGAFAVGLGLLAIEAVAAAWRRDRQGVLRFLAVGVLSLIGLLANPWGAGVLAYATRLPTNQVVTGMVTEWAPATMCDPTGAPPRPRRSGSPRSWRRGRGRLQGFRTSSFGWRCWLALRSGRCAPASGSGSRCRSRSALWPGSVGRGPPTPTVACRSQAAWCWPPSRSRSPSPSPRSAERSSLMRRRGRS